MNNMNDYEKDERCKEAVLYGSSFFDERFTSTTAKRFVFITVARTIALPPPAYSEAFETMLASEDVLRKEWDTPEEDEAWENL